MKQKKRLLLIPVFLLAFHIGLMAQKSDTIDSPEKLPMIFPTYAFQWPGGDLSERFGANSSIGAGFLYKTHRNWLVGLDACFIFGNIIKQDSLMQNLYTSDGYIIGQDGQYADMGIYERGFNTSFKLGKIFPVFGSNKNSGIMFLAGAGYLQHKIRIEVRDNTAPQVGGEYKKGYDRLTSGFQVSEFLGYMYIGNSRLANFFAGLEWMQAWTENRRSMNFDEGRRDDSKRLDMLYGIKIGWIIPFRKRLPKDFYYY